MTFVTNDLIGFSGAESQLTSVELELVALKRAEQTAFETFCAESRAGYA